MRYRIGGKMAKKKELSFEEALKELKKSAENIKSKDLTLDESISLYEHGIKHYELCKKILDETKQKIEIFREEDYDAGEL